MDIFPVLKGDDRSGERCVVRLKTSYWQDKKGIYIKRGLSFLRRKSAGYDLLQEDSIDLGVEEVITKIINFNECEDGIYEVGIINKSRDWESGYVEDYDYQLYPFIEESK